MALIKKFLKQTAVYWAPAGADAYGNTLYLDPVEMKCRWEDVEVQFQTTTGSTAVSRSVVYTELDVKILGLLFLGTLGDVEDPDNPKENEGVWEIRKFNKIPDRRAKEFLRTAVL